VSISRSSTSSLQNAFPKYNNIWDGRSAVGSMDAISSITLTSNQPSITFNNIPQTYTHLQIRYLAQSTNSAVAADNLAFRFNYDATANYTRHYLDGNNTTASAGANTGVTQVYATCAQTSSTYPNIFGSGILDILDYTNTNKYKTTKAISGVDFNAVGGAIQFTSGLWINTEAITTINIRALAGNLATYSSFSLYGTK
jgi:hypothetical protein